MILAATAIGIQYQQGLKDLLPASDLVEGTLNNARSSAGASRDGSRVLYEGRAAAAFQRSGRMRRARWADDLSRSQGDGPAGRKRRCTTFAGAIVDRSGTVPDYVWVFEISGSVPPAHLINGWAGAAANASRRCISDSAAERSKASAGPGEIVWSRIYIDDGKLKMDLGRAGAVELPMEETQRRWDATTPQWPIMHAVTYGVTRDQMMARHKANHIQVAYANSAEEADKAMLAKAAMAHALGIHVALCGTERMGRVGNSDGSRTMAPQI